MGLEAGDGLVSAATSATSALEVFFLKNEMRYINPRFTYLVTYLLTITKIVEF